MKIFITGSSGYIGSELVKYLSDKHKIVLYDLINRENILDYEQLKEKMIGCDVVIHLAAIRGPDESKEFNDYFNINCQGTLNVINCAIENNVARFIYASSTGYYGLEKGIDYIKPIKETNLVISQYAKSDKLNCRDCDIAYGTSKAIAEQILANYGLRKKIDIIILRLGPIGSNRSVFWSLDGITLKIDNAIKSIDLAINLNKNLWYEAFTITDDNNLVDLSKAKNILNYRPL